MTTLAQQRAAATPNAGHSAGRASGARALPPWASAAGRAVGEGCQRCLEFAVARYRQTGTIVTATWPFLPETVHTTLLATAGGLALSAFTTHRRQSLLRLAEAVKFRSRVRKTIRRWPDVIGRNAAIKVVEKVEDVAGKPHRAPGLRVIPVLLHGRKAFRRVGWRIRYFGPRRTPYGITVTVDGSPTGTVCAGLQSEMSVIVSSLDAHSGNAYPNRWRKHWTDCSIMWRDPFAEVIRPEDLPSASEPLSVVLGVDSDGIPLEHSMWLPTLIVGRKGSGKSRVVRRMLQGLCESGQPFLVWVFDPKGRGQEFGWLRDGVYRYESEPDAWPQFIAGLCTAMVEQASRLGSLRLSECPLRDPRFPLIVAIVDELGTAVDETSNKKRITVAGKSTTVEKALSRYLRESRSAGATMAAGSQVIQKEKLGLIRDLFDFTICLGVNNRETAQIATGDAKLYPAHLIPAGRQFAGTGYGNSADKGVTQFRCAYVADGAPSEAIAEMIAAWTAVYADAEIRDDGYHLSPLDQALVEGLMGTKFDKAGASAR